MKKETPIEILEKTNAEQLREFLMEEFANDAKLMLRFADFINAPEKKKQMISQFEADVKSEVKAIIKESRGRRRCIDCYAAQSFCREMNKLLGRILAESPTQELRFKLQMHILNQLEQIVFEGDDEQLLSLIHKILGDIALMFESEENYRDMIFRTFMRYITDEKHSDNFTNEIENFVLNFCNEEFDEEIEKYVEGMIKRLNSVSGEYGFRKSIIDYVMWMLNHKSEYGAKEKELMKYARLYWNDFEVRNFFFERFVGESRWKDAIALLEEGLEIDEDNPKMVCYYQQNLRQLYPKVGRRKECIETIYKLMDSSMWLDIELLEELKSQFNEKEWIEERERLLEKFSSNSYNVALLLHHEGLTDRLAEVILKTPNTYLLDNYAKDIDPKYYPAVIELYEKEYRFEIEACYGRADYRSLIRKMNNAHNIEGGKELTDRLTKEWMQVYDKRTALQDEIRKFRNENGMTE